LMISGNAEFLPPIFYTVFWQPFWKWQTSQKFWKCRIAPLMVTYHYVKFYVSIIIHLEVITINVRNFNFPIGFNPLYHKAEILSSSSWDLPWTSSWSAERKEKEKNNNNNNNNKKQSKNNKSPKLCLGDLNMEYTWQYQYFICLWYSNRLLHEMYSWC
jgi:hypothetical protein